MKALITGADGFIGRNLCQHLAERPGLEVVRFTRAHTVAELPQLMRGVQFVFHLAGVNRPQDPQEFFTGNAQLTEQLAQALQTEMTASGRAIPLVYTSSTQAARDNSYGVSKRAAEETLQALRARTNAPVHVFRLPNVFGKWCRPNYNSAVATFCHHIARGQPIRIDDAAAPLTLVYVDDVVQRFLQLLDGADAQLDEYGYCTVSPQYTITVGELASTIERFRDSRATLTTPPVGAGLLRALYATYVSHLPPQAFAYSVLQHSDARGVFVEMLKTPDCGQFSYFTAHPGVTRGGHYHHTKTEKFLVIKGHARFRFRHIVTGETHALETRGERAEIVETVPGWTHDITNIGADELVVMLWANEVFDRARPDTYASPL